MVPDVFTQLLRTEYLTAQGEIYSQPPAPVERILFKVPSTGRIESYLFGSMPGQMQKFMGSREYQKFNADAYVVENEQFYNAFEANKIDIEDDKVGMYPMYARQMVERARQFPADLGLQKLCLRGETDLCFDKTTFFATSHNIGTMAITPGAGQGNFNKVLFTAASADGLTHKMIFVMNNGYGGIRPVLLQEREPLSQLQTDQGTPQAEERMAYRYWCDARYGVGFGWWWDAILVTITNTPNLTELQTIFERVVSRFRSFRLPTSGRSSDPPRGPHDNVEFTPTTCTVLVPGHLEVAMRSITDNETIVQSGAPVTNFFKGKASVIYTAYLTA